MKTIYTKAIQAALSASLLVTAGLAGAATTVNLTAQRSATTLPDGTTARMWQFCATAPATSDSGGTVSSVGCGSAWAPGPTITVRVGDTLNIQLNNTLPVPTSIVVLGQLGGGLGSPVRMAAPIAHAGQTETTFPGAGTADVPLVPPAQVARVQSFATEVGAGTVQSLTWANLKAGTYLYETGTLPSIQAPMGLYGVLVVTQSPIPNDPNNGGNYSAGKAYPAMAGGGVPYDADATLLFSEIDAVQNAAVDAAAVAGSSVTKRFDDPTCAPACYPAAVNYTPTYFLINGKPFDITQPAQQSYALGANYASGNLLLRLVNAGSRLHVPAAVGLPFSLIAEDGNVAPGLAKVQNEVSLPAGKTQDVIVKPAHGVGGYIAASFALFDRQLSTATAGQTGGMQAFLQINGASTPTSVTPTLNDDAFKVPFNTAINGNVKLNDIAVAKVALRTGPTLGTVSLAIDGSFIYTPNAGATGDDTFTYTGSNTDTNTKNYATVTLKIGTAAGAPHAVADSFTSAVKTSFKTNAPGVLANDTNAAGTKDITLTVDTASVNAGTCGAGLSVAADGSFSVKTATPVASCSFTYKAKNAQGTLSANPATVTVAFGAAGTTTGLNVVVKDAISGQVLTDYRWLVQEDLTFKHDVSQTPSPTTRTIGTSFHRAHMTVVASGCVGAKSCGSGQAIRVDDTTIDPVTKTKGARHTVTDAEALAKAVGLNQVALDPTKNYYVSILPGDALDDAGGHLMGGVAVSKTTIANIANETLVIKTEATPVIPAQLSIFIYEDNNPTNNQYDTGEQGLGGFNMILMDAVGRSGDVAGQQTYDMFGMPLANALLGLAGCPDLLNTHALIGDDGQSLTGVVYTCPNASQAEIDGAVASDLALDPTGATTTNQDALSLKYALAGHALIKYLEPSRYDVIAHPAASREAAGERWWETETLEGTPAQDAFVGTKEAKYFQEFGPPGFHTSIGFVNPDHVTSYGLAFGDIKPAAADHFSISGRVTNTHMSRPSNVKLWDSDGYDMLSSTICQVVLNSGAGDGPAIAITECNPDGSFSIAGVPNGDYEIQVWDRWLDQIIQATAVSVNGGNVDLNTVPVLSWFTQHDQNIFLDLNKNGVYDEGEPGIANALMTNRYRNGSISNQTLSDSAGNGILVELFPLFNWYVSEVDTTRFKQTGVNVIVDAGGPVNNTGTRNRLLPDGSTAPTGHDPHLTSTVYQATANGVDGCDPTGVPSKDLGPACPAANTSDRVEIPGAYSYGNQGFISQRNRIDWGRTPYAVGENGGIGGTVVYASTRPFDDQRQNIQNIWAPLVPRVTVNLYRKVTQADGSTTLELFDTTQTSSFDDWVNTVFGSDGNKYILGSDGTLRDPATGALAPSGVTAGRQANMQCPGQRGDDPFVQFTLATQGSPDQYRCYDGFHNWNQVQAAPYDGRYQFPSEAYIAAHPLTVAQKAAGHTLVSLPVGEYVVESITPQGYEIVKEEDKNIFTGDQFQGPAYQQFVGLGNVFILPDQATLNNDNPYAPRTADGVRIIATTNNGVTGGYDQAMPPCVGSLHRVPDFLTAFPGAGLAAPFAGMDKPLCDRKQVKVVDQTLANASFFIFTEVPLAANGAGIILDDASSEYNAASPDFGEKASVPFVPVSVKDFNGIELTRVYADQWGAYNLMYPSSWTVNPPTPSGYLPNMLVNCMNDPGPIPERLANGTLSGRMITDPQYNAAYSNFCYTLPFVPGQTTYLDTPVLPIAAFAQGYNPADCEYPDLTPAIAKVDSSEGFGPYLKTTGGTLTITALGDRMVPNPAYAGPFATSGPASVRDLKRHYGFGGTKGTVKIGNVTLPGAQLTWADEKITVQVPAGTPTGQLVVTTAGGRSSIDGVTVTLENKTPTRVDGGAGQTIQAAIDAATPGDLILINEGVYNELVVMWKPVRLQGVGGASVYVNATKFPTTKLATWRPVINALFGVDINTGNNTVPAQVDGLPTQEITGGVVLLEPSVLGTEEGAGITVLAKGIDDATGNPLTGSNADCGRSAPGVYPNGVTITLNLDNGSQTSALPGLSNFLCAASRIDGLGVTGGDAGGGIYVNGWAHNLEISNNRVFGNAGAYNGGIRIGVPYLELETLPDAIGNGANARIPGFGYDKNVKIHHNYVAKNGTVEAPAGAGGAGGGISICTGTDGYSVDHNWVCGNYSSSDGGGIGHIGYSQNGTIAFNQILFNESAQQTSSVSGGGIAVVAEPILAGNLAIGTGNITIDANVIRGNLTAGGTGGGIRIAGVNGQDVSANPTNKALWFTAVITNNIIDNNVAGWAGGGISLFDTILATIDNNTIASNDSVGIAGVILNADKGRPEPAGIVSQQNSTALSDIDVGGLLTTVQKTISSPTMVNNIIWKNRSFYYGSNNKLCVGNSVASTSGPCVQLADQATTGQCPAGAKYWDIGLLDDSDTTPGSNVFRLNPSYSVLTSLSTTYVNKATTVGINSATHTGSAVTITTSGAHGFPNGSFVTIDGVNVGAYNGTYQITGVGPATNRFTYTDTNVNQTVFNTSLTHVGNVVTVTTAQPHGFLSGSTVNITGVTPTAYNGQYTITVTSPTSYTYTTPASNNLSAAIGSSLHGGGGQANTTVTLNLTAALNVVNGNQVIVSGINPVTPYVGTFYNGTFGLTNVGNGRTRLRYTVNGVQNAPSGTGGQVDVVAATVMGQSAQSAASGSGGSATIFVPSLNTEGDPQLADLYCNGARITPEFPAVINPPSVKNYQVAATADEGANYVNIKFGPLSTSKPTDASGTAYTTLGDYHLAAAATAATSSALNHGTTGVSTHDIDNDGRPQNGAWDIGADEWIAAPASLSISKTSNAVNAKVVTGQALTYTIVASNAGPNAALGATVLDTLPGKFAATPAPTWTCTASAGSNCPASGTGSIANVPVDLLSGGSATFTVNATVAANASGTIVNTAILSAPASVTDVNLADNTSTATVTVVPAQPTLNVLDNFNRSNANNLGTNWNVFLTSSIRIAGNQASCNNIVCVAGGAAYWSGNGSPFGSKQGAAFTVTGSNGPINGTALVLKATGGSNTIPANFIRVRYNNGNLIVETATNLGATISNVTSLPATVVNGNRVMAAVDNTGLVNVWVNSNFIGSAQLPAGNNNIWTTGGGRIGMQLPSGQTVDDFSGGTLP